MSYRGIDISRAAFYRVTDDTAKELIDFRLSARKPLTQRAFDRAMAEAAKCEAHGVEAEEAVQITIDKGWQGVVLEYVLREVANRRAASTETQLMEMRHETGSKHSSFRRAGGDKSTASDAAALRELERIRGTNGADMADPGSVEDGSFPGWQH